ncbi:hypothetical protein BV25DRAFT_1822618 [Artomyces pyxidatus]|uniref:Uncharacterized protein n=1 Tax=Artomyces pyxidatus TaxID=48021 RepID=A0ACB8T7V0_9AGAM|nr:hypothetical protein BV25DRAFT_1822618 [Artomyces pyxidatus]
MPFSFRVLELACAIPPGASWTMTNWNDPVLLAKEYTSFIKLVHVLGGLYIWEFFTNLDFEWSIITGRRKCRWTLGLYLGTRLSALAAVVAIFVGFDVESQIDCQTWLTLVFLFGYSGFLFAAALIVLRIMAIWERNIPVMIIAVAAWLTNTAFYFHNLARPGGVIGRAAWSTETGACAIQDTVRNRANIIVTLATDAVLLLLMLFGLLRYRNAGMVRGGIWKILYNQGLLWVVVVTVAEVPPTVFIILNLNDALNLMFQVPELVIMAIGATRIYRSLAEFSSISDLLPIAHYASERPQQSSSVQRALSLSSPPAHVSGGNVYVMDAMNMSGSTRAGDDDAFGKVASLNDGVV